MPMKNSNDNLRESNSQCLNQLCHRMYQKTIMRL